MFIPGIATEIYLKRAEAKLQVKGGGELLKLASPDYYRLKKQQNNRGKDKLNNFPETHWVKPGLKQDRLALEILDSKQCVSYLPGTL